MGFAVALVIALVATPLAALLARTLGIVDRPGPLKVHTEAVPYLGGLAVFAAAAPVVAVDRLSLLVPLALALALGIADDAHDLPPGARLAAEAGIGAVAGVLAPAGDGVVAGFVTAAAVVLLLNAVNLLDGLDALAAGVTLVSCLGFAALGGPGRTPALALAGALVGFLAYNRPPASIYLGDGGAYLLGTALALFGARTFDAAPSGASAVAVGLLVAVPVLDTVVAIVRRRIAGRPLFQGDRSHLYDQAVDRGLSAGSTVILFVAVQAAFAAVALLVP